MDIQENVPWCVVLAAESISAMPINVTVIDEQPVSVKKR